MTKLKQELIPTEKKVRRPRRTAEEKAREKERIKEEKAQERARIREEKKVKAMVEKEEATPRKEVKEVPYSIKESSSPSKNFIIVLTPEGEIWVDPVPRYCNFLTFRNFISSCPDLSDNNVNFKSSVSVTKFDIGEIATSVFDGTRKQNPFAYKFGVRNETKVVGGNLIFSGPERGFTKKEVSEIYPKIIETLQTPEEVNLD